MSSNSSSASTSPKVSVIIPVYNTDAYLYESLDSICNQTLKSLEIILINDGSTDNSQQIIEEYARKDSRIRYSIQPNQRQGVALTTDCYWQPVNISTLWTVTIFWI